MRLLIILFLFFSWALSANASDVASIAPNFWGALTFSEIQKDLFLEKLNAIVKTPTGKRLLTTIETLFTKYSYMYANPKPKVNILSADCTAFKPTETMPAQPKKAPSKEVTDQNDERHINFEQKYLDLIKEHKEQIDQTYDKLRAPEDKKLAEKATGRRCTYIMQRIDQIAEEDPAKQVMLGIKTVHDQILEIEAVALNTSDSNAADAEPSSKNKDLNIYVGANDLKDEQLVPCAVAVEADNVLIIPYKFPFFIMLAHELIHMKHYLEEQIFRADSLSAVADILFTQKNDPRIAHLFAQLPSADAVYSALYNSAEIRKAIFHNDYFAYFDEKVLGDDNLIWSLKKGAAESLQKMAYSIACAGYIPGALDNTIFPESGVRAPELVRDLLQDIEERRTVIGPDRDAITEAAIRMEADLPIRYICQNDSTIMYESSKVLETVCGTAITDYTKQNAKKWIQGDLETYKAIAQKSLLTYKE